MRRFIKDRRAVAAIEFALAVPFLLAGVLGTFEAGRLIRASFRLADAASTMADLVAQQMSVTTTEMTNFCNGSMLDLTPFPTSTFAAAVASVTYSTSTSTRVTDWQDTTCGSAPAMTNQVALATTVTPTIGDTAIVVTATYTYTLTFSTILAGSFTLTRTATSRPRANATVTRS